MRNTSVKLLVPQQTNMPLLPWHYIKLFTISQQIHVAEHTMVSKQIKKKIYIPTPLHVCRYLV